ncbi:methyl-accepting chemotaxis protein [Pseudoduganella sp. GCM10020061]|uniref:methyl-accepting chemotaxis protein n=1 Tax=Pseudoduganella sp. GCM10020061 TaxID=3317345 RepID=UPI00363D328B
MKLTIKNRLILSNVLSLVFLTIVGLIGFDAVRRLDNAMADISSNSLAMKDQLQADQAHDALRADALASQLAMASGDQAQRAEVTRQIREHADSLQKLLAAMEARTTDPELKRGIAQVKPDAEAFLKSAAGVAAVNWDEPYTAQEKFEAFQKHFSRFGTSMEGLSERMEAHSTATAQRADEVVAAARIQLAIVAGLAVLVTLVLGVLTKNAIIRPLDEVIDFASRVSSGDLGFDLDADKDDHTETGRLKHALSSMRGNLHQIVSRVRAGTDSIATASQEIAAGNQDLSVRTETQASSLQETASTVEELTTTVKQNADNARQANQLALSASGVAVKGGSVVAKVVTAMDSIDDASRKIADITGVIEGIAFQTNILALNAAVEAARAGEQGRGFAVVASEVRNLAQRSNTAAKEIKQLISTSAEHVDQGAKLVDEAGTTMQEIVDSVRRVTDIMSEISAASHEQESGIEQVNHAVTQIDTVTQQNAALVEQAAAAAEAMRAQAAELADIVSIFKLDNAGASQRIGRSARLAIASAHPAARAPAPEEWEG